MARAQTQDGEQCPWHDTLIENLGKSGTDGRLGNVIKKVREQDKEMETIKKAQIDANLKLALFTGGTSLAGGGIVALIMKLLG